MKPPKRLLRNKKGVSSLFIAIYAAVLTVILISTLFLGTSILQSSLADSLRVEQKRNQEKILLTGPEGMIVDDDSDIVNSLKVNNTGAITVRIKALYIDGKFICDPSEFIGDSYIAPGDALWINLAGSDVTYTENKDNLWTLVTERGTKSSEIGYRILQGGDDSGSRKFYFGPLALDFENFHWRSGNGPWINGWEIPTGTVDVTWKIYIQNVDDRAIIIDETSFFTLVGTESQQNKIMYWYIDHIDPNPDPGSMRLEPGEKYYIYYILSKPKNEQGGSYQKITMPPMICTNFLLFSGTFVEQNGNRLPFGQTIPFEAVRITG